MVPENDNLVPQSSDAAPESPQSILERRLAEIQKQSSPEASATDEPAAVPAPATDQIQERPDQGPPTVAGQPEGAGTAEAPAVIPAETGGTPTFAADISPSDSQARAEAHYGDQNPGVVSARAAAADQNAPATDTPADNAASNPVSPDATLASEGPDTPATAPDAPPTTTLPAIELASAEAIEDAPEALAALPTSDNEGAAEAAAQAPASSAPAAEPATPGPDFATLDLAAQTDYLLGALRQPDARQRRRQLMDLHRQYEATVASDQEEARQRFVAEGGVAEDFAYQGSAKQQELSKAVREFRESRARDAKAEDEQRARNLTHKQHLLSQLRQLVEAAETKDSSARIKALQSDWKAIGPVPQQESQELWNNYHALLDIFYNNRGLFFEMKELDRRRNLEAKEALVQRATGLSEQSNVNKALQELRQLHEEWKHIGPVPNEQRDPIWNRFLAASEQVHNRKKELQNVRSTQEQENLTRKQALLEQMQPFADFQTERVNDWRAKTDELQKLKQEWDAIGLVPREQADQLNKQFWGTYKGFFQHKNQYFKALDEEKSQNLKQKLALCEQAEEALQNPDWEAGREVVVRLQKEWKLIGRVPEKQSDKVWKRFRTACDSFFDRKNQETRQRQEQAQQVSREQATHLDSVAEALTQLSPDNPGTLEGFRQQVAEWRALGNAEARGGERTEEKFQSLMGRYLDAVPGLSYADRADLLFQLQVERLKAGADSQQALYKKEQALRREINELENDIATLQTNLDFFARSKNADQLRADYQGRIEEAKKRIEALKKQLKIIRS